MRADCGRRGGEFLRDVGEQCREHTDIERADAVERTACGLVSGDQRI